MDSSKLDIHCSKRRNFNVYLGILVIVSDPIEVGIVWYCP